RLLAAQSARRQGNVSDALRHLEVCQQQDGLKEAVDLEYRLLRLIQDDLTEAKTLLKQCEDHPEDAHTPVILEGLIIGLLQSRRPAYTLQTPPRGEMASNLTLARQAVDLWMRTRSGEPDHIQGLVWRGRVRLFLHELPPAQEDLRKAVELAPDHF